MNDLDRIMLQRADEQTQEVKFDGGGYFKAVWGKCGQDACDRLVSLTHSKSGLCREHARQKSGH